MSRYLWRENYAIGDEEIDAQHRQLFVLLDRLYASVCSQDQAQAVERVAEELVAATREHFLHEEAFMRRVQYPRLEAHQAEHQRLLADVNQRLEALRQGERIVSVELLEFMNDWLSHHIAASDRALGEYSQQRNLP